MDNVKALLGCIKYDKAKELQGMFDDVIKYIHDVETERDDALKQLRDWNKNEEIVALKNELNNLRCKSDFVLSEDEELTVKNWVTSHNNDKHKGNTDSGAIGGRFTYCFTPTSIGTVGEVVCTCGDKFTFRDL